MRICTCEKIDLGYPFDANQHCRLCWLYWHNKEYNLSWGGKGNIVEIKEGLVNKPPFRPVSIPKPCNCK